MADTDFPGRSVYDYQEFYKPDGTWNPDFNYLLEIPYWDTARTESEVRAALDKVHAAQLAQYNADQKQYVTDYTFAVKKLLEDPTQAAFEADQKAAVDAAAAQQKSIDAYNTAEAQRLQAYNDSIGHGFWYSVTDTDNAALPTTVAAPAPSAADMAAETLRQATQKHAQRLTAALSDNNQRLVQEEAAAAATRHAASVASAAAIAGAAVTPTARPPQTRVGQALDTVFKSINWRK